MKTQSIVLGAPPYGAAELKRVLQKYLTFAVVIAAGIHFTLIGAYYGVARIDSILHPPKKPGERVITIHGPVELPPPPSIDNIKEMLPNVVLAGTAVKPDYGNPVPIPDAQVNPEAVFATQAEVNRMDAMGAENGIGDGDVLVLAPTDNDDLPPSEHVVIERKPVVVKSVIPVYPEIARQAGLPGRVVAHLWVDKKGRVREVRIIQSTSEMFTQAVVDAAMQIVFTPAMMNQGPVSVWMAMPFVFKLE
jgi:protein TonB